MGNLDIEFNVEDPKNISKDEMLKGMEAETFEELEERKAYRKKQKTRDNVILGLSIALSSLSALIGNIPLAISFLGYIIIHATEKFKHEEIYNSNIDRINKEIQNYKKLKKQNNSTESKDDIEEHLKRITNSTLSTMYQESIANATNKVDSIVTLIATLSILLGILLGGMVTPALALIGPVVSCVKLLTDKISVKNYKCLDESLLDLKTKFAELNVASINYYNSLEKEKAKEQSELDKSETKEKTYSEEDIKVVDEYVESLAKDETDINKSRVKK